MDYTELLSQISQKRCGEAALGNPKRHAEFSRILLAAAVLCAMIASPRIAAAAEQRVALVIGNSAYPSSPLRNPVNDATSMAGKLRALGFEVILRTNTTQRDMNRAVVQFGEKLTAGSVGLFYYAGHGLQVRGKNYLVPIDAEINSESAVRSESVDVDQVLDQFAFSRLSMVILDACRNNPFERRFRAGGGGGLAQIDAPKGTLIAYATAPGRTAADGAGANGVYTEQLLKAMDAPGTKVEDVFKQVRINVARATQDQQIPWEASSLTGEFYFRVPVEKPVLATPASTPAPGVDPAAFEMAFWDSIKTSTNRADFEAYLEQYPKGRFAPLARSRVAALQTAAPSQAGSSPARAGTENERAELIKTMEEERRKRDRDAEAVKQEMEKLRAELQKATQLALASPTSGPAAAGMASFAAEWAPRLALLEQNQGRLTFAKAVAILLDISSASELSQLLTHENEIKSKRWNAAYAIGADSKGKIIWGGGYQLLRAFAAQTALEQCGGRTVDSCKVVMVNGEFLEKDFMEMAKRLGAQSVAVVRESYLRSLSKPPTESIVVTGMSSSYLSFPTGYSSLRE